MWRACKFDIGANEIAVLTLNRPEQLNALNSEMFEDIINACDIVKKNAAIKVLIITGAGRGFSTGGDIGLMGAMTDSRMAHETFDHSTRAVRAVYELDKPVIAAINGPVAGASTSLMMACDLVVAAEQAVFGFTFINVAFCPDSGCSYFLTRKVGLQKAAEILWFGKKLNSAEALNLGLVNTVVPDDRVMLQAFEWANKLAAGPSRTLDMSKKLLRMAESNDFHRQAEQEGSFQVLAWLSEDFKEGTLAFLEKRKPNYQGK